MGETVPAKVIPTKNVAFSKTKLFLFNISFKLHIISVSVDGVEHPKYTYEVLCGGSPHWVHIEDGQILPNAIAGGWF